jgi:hypothetical protein
MTRWGYGVVERALLWRPGADNVAQSSGREVQQPFGSRDPTAPGNEGRRKMNDTTPASAVGELSAAGLDLVQSLPPELRPNATSRGFPHVVNRMAEIWRRPLQMDRYFDSLLVDERGGRKGFPLSVLFEITTLKDYYQTQLYPRTAEKGTWDPRSRL